MAVENLIYIPIVALIALFWFLGSRIFKNEEDSTTLQNKKKHFDKLENINLNTRLNDTAVEKELNLLKGKRIEKVFYINLNYPHYEFEKFDSIDFGVILQLEGGSYLNWLFNEGASNSEDINNHTGFYLDFSNVIHSLNNSKSIFDVSEDKKWKKFINSIINNFELKRIDFEGDKVCEKLIIETKSKDRVGIFSTTEPDIIEKETIQVSLDFETEWTIVVFDQELLMMK